MRKLLLLSALFAFIINHAVTIVSNPIPYMGSNAVEFEVTDPAYMPAFYADPGTGVFPLTGWSYFWQTDEGAISQAEKPVFYFKNANTKNELSLAEEKLKVKDAVLKLQISALKELTVITRNNTPSIWWSPSFDEGDAFSIVYFSMDSLRHQIDEFLLKYSFVSPTEVNELLESIMYECNIQDYSRTSEHDYEPSSKELLSAKNVINWLNNAIKSFKVDLNLSKS